MKNQVLLSCLIALVIFITNGLFAQVGINADGSQPDPSAMLDVKSAVRGFLPPRVALTSANIAAPVATPVAIGLLVFNTVVAGTLLDQVMPGYYYWNGGKWIAVTTPQGINKGDMLFWNGASWATIPSGMHGQQLSFCYGQPTWGGCEPQVATVTCTSSTQSSILSGGNVTDEGGTPVIHRGVCWSTHEFPTISDDTTINGSGPGAFSSLITGLNPGTIYFVRAYSTNESKTGYGEQKTDTTSEFSGAPVMSMPLFSACPNTPVLLPVKVSGFNNIGSIALTIHYNSTALSYTVATNTSDYPGLTFNGTVPGEITISGASTAGISYPDNSILFTLEFTYTGGAADLTWFDNGSSCQFTDGNQDVLNDLPTCNYYLPGQITERPEVGLPIFTNGTASSRCMASESIAYPATAANSSGIIYSLDPVSVAAGNSINVNTGAVTYSASWIGASVITAEALGCNGPKSAQHHATTNPIMPVSSSIISTDDTVCAGTLVTFTASVVNGGQNPSWQWKLNGSDIPGATNITYTYSPSTGQSISCKVTSDILCTTGSPAPSNTIITVVHPILPVSVTIAASANPVCPGTNVVFTATPVNGGANPAYQWNVNGTDVPGATNSTYYYAPVEGDAVKCIMVSSAPCTTGNPATSNVENMGMITQMAVGVVISALENPSCAGSDVVFTAIPVNGGLFPAYQWKVNAIEIQGATNATYHYIPLQDDLITCVVTSSADCVTGNPATSNTVDMQVNQANPVSVTIMATQDTVCAGVDVVFTAIPVNGGSIPAYQWNVNGSNVPGATNATFNYLPLHYDIVKCELTSDVACATGNPAFSAPIIITVNPLLNVGVGISTPVNPVCAGTLVPFLAIPVNGGNAPLYQWQLSGTDITGATDATYSFTAVNFEDITCKLTSDALCATGSPAISAVTHLGVNPLLPVSISASPSANPVCQGTSVTFTSSVINGGANPAYQWIVNGSNMPGATNATFIYVPAANDVVKCLLTSDALCGYGSPATSNEIPMVVTDLLIVGSISGDQVVYPNMTPAELIGTPPSNGTTPAYQMQQSSDNTIFTDIAGATSLNYQPGMLTQTTYYRQMQNATGPCGGPMPTNVVTIAVNSALSAGVTISPNPSATVCGGVTVTYTAVPENGGTSPFYHWMVNGMTAGTNSPTFSYIPLHGDAVSCTMTSNLPYVINNPASSNTIDMTVNPVLTAGVSMTVEPAGTICAGTLVTFTAIPVNGGTSPAYQWLMNGLPLNGATNATYSSPTLGNGTMISVMMTSNAAPCLEGSPATSSEVSMVVIPVVAASVSIVDQPTGAVCGGTSVTFTATPVNGGTAPTYQWKSDGEPISGATDATYTSILSVSALISVEMTSNLTPCLSGSPATSNIISKSVNPIAPVSITISESANNVCAQTGVTFTAAIENGGTNPLYQWKLNGTNITGATSSTYLFAPSNGAMVSCVLTSNAACTTGNPAISEVDTMIVIPKVYVKTSIVSSAYAMMPGTEVTLTASVENGGTAPVYQWKVGNTVVGTNSSTHSYVPSNLDKVTCTVTSNSTAACLSNNPAKSTTLSMIVYVAGSACTAAPTVVYGGKTYNTVQIGTQCWMRENMNIGTQVPITTTQTNNAVIEKYCYNDSTYDCDVYGGLYQWNEMMQYSTTPGTQGICPTGWHIPTEAEAITLATFVGGAPVAGGKLKEAGTGHFRSPNTGATNEFGFTMLPTGYSYVPAALPSTPYYSNMFQNGYFHTSTDYALPNGPVFRSGSLSAATLGTFYNSKTTGHPVRCLKN